VRPYYSRNPMRSSDLSDMYELLQRLLIQAREEAGMSQQEVADRLGRHQTFVSKCERGERRMDLIEFLATADAIGFDPHTFIKKLDVSKSVKRKSRRESSQRPTRGG